MTARPRSTRRGTLACATAALAVAGCADSPSVFRTAGPVAGHLATLGWTLTIISALVTAIVTALLLAALFRRRPERSDAVQRSHHERSVTWIVVGGVVVPAVILVAAFVMTMLTQAAVTAPPRRPVATVQVTGHRWWWEVQYVTSPPNGTVVTANEIHVPVGQPVQLELLSTDVIHSFWVPALAGKMDLIPGQKNTMWIQADTAGTYWGQCAEYCGLQHAHMDFVVVAESPDEFQAWLAGQRAPAAEPASDDAARGRRVFLANPCAACHAIRGTDALGRVGPDLTHIGGRLTLAAGTLPNTRGHLAGWISNAQAIKPGSYMPTMALSPTELQVLVTYLESLR